MEELGINIADYRSRPITADMVRRSDFIFVMTYGHLDSMLLLFPQAADKTFLVREFDTDLPVMEREVADPLGRSVDEYRMCRDQIRRSLPRLLDLVLRTTGAAPIVAGPNTKNVFLAIEDNMSDLRPTVLDFLNKQGLTFEDGGAFAEAGGEDVNMARRAAQAVAGERVERAILVCRYGINCMIAANKVSGVRAVLASDAETARASRELSDANVLCVAAKDLKTKKFKEILESWMSASYNGKPGQPLAEKMETTNKTERNNPLTTGNALAHTDPPIFAAIEEEKKRLRDGLEMIPSENYVSRAVLEAQGSVMTNKYAEGYPGRRYYGGCEFVDVAEQLAISRLKELFGAEHANVQPHSGSQANMAVYFSVLQPGDTILAMELSHGGHLTHGHPKNFSGRFFKVVPYGVTRENETIDYDQVAALAREHRPKMIVAGATAYSRIINFERFRQIADEVGAYLFCDVAHIAGLIAGGMHPSPVPFADFVTTTTHKTLRGPRGGVIMCKEKHAKAIDSMIIPGTQGGPLMHVIAAKAVCFAEAQKPEFKAYAEQIVHNSKALCEGLKKCGYRIVSGGTDNHLMLVDLQPKEMTGKEAQETLDKVGITLNKNTIPYDTQSAVKTSGIRLGTPALTTRGMKEDEMFDIAHLIDDALRQRNDPVVLEKIRNAVKELAQRFPLPY